MKVVYSFNEFQAAVELINSIVPEKCRIKPEQKSIDSLREHKGLDVFTSIEVDEGSGTISVVYDERAVLTTFKVLNGNGGTIRHLVSMVYSAFNLLVGVSEGIKKELKSQLAKLAEEKKDQKEGTQQPVDKAD